MVICNGTLLVSVMVEEALSEKPGSIGPKSWKKKQEGAPQQNGMLQHNVDMQWHIIYMQSSCDGH